VVTCTSTPATPAQYTSLQELLCGLLCMKDRARDEFSSSAEQMFRRREVTIGAPDPLDNEAALDPLRRPHR
jgi:hypothetical protein